ncbi:MAG: prepilin-type N-terminal cleavage/methylation domain-containing protein [Acidimicrobiales bacterium]
MTSTYQKLKRRRDAGEIDGFTLIEILIVIVVLGILAAVVIFALGGITGKTALASCQADGATVASALSAFNAQNPGFAGTTNYTQADLLPSATGGTPLGVVGGPYIQSWPSNLPHYAFQLTSAGILQVSTGVTESAGVFTPTAADGNLTATGTDAVGGSLSPWYNYATDVACTDVT